MQIAPGLVLAFFEAVVMASIAVAISTRLPIMPNLVICFTIYVLGHLAPVLPHSAAGRLPMVQFVADLLSTILPSLDSFNIYGAISTDKQAPAGVSWLGGPLLPSLHDGRDVRGPVDVRGPRPGLNFGQWPDEKRCRDSGPRGHAVAAHHCFAARKDCPDSQPAK